ncbi:hypothetical protein HOP50_04g35010 [Chloropicon primus]|uniref:Uncharacterized protein n=1 Tax=Chloropicon primus TaxID=1764295 RepID=A0A5B8MKH5_9CHLO|nr:hypothetical protein A3770_04p34940 [Chloropicon primus]UPR00187.1 hypothetical protein HOP50_04g35010 [Chloropicon primus]|eukprot:QDZ20976.1 hypothetical protein A3770_04p34940 [Chloropicon primus]
MGCCMMVPTRVADGNGFDFSPPPPPPPIKKHWITQVTQGGQEETFKTFEEWQECFEPKKGTRPKANETKKSEDELREEAELREESKDEEKAERKKQNAQKILTSLLDKVSKKITTKAMVLVLSFVAKMLEMAQKLAREKGNSDLAGFLNCLCAMVCTFRFSHRAKHKFAYIRKELVAPELVKRLKAVIEKADVRPEEFAATVAGEILDLLQNEECVTRALRTVSTMPLVSSLHGKVLGDEMNQLSEEDVDKAMSNLLVQVSAKVQAASAGKLPPGMSGYAGMAIGMLLAGMQQSMRGQVIVEKIIIEINKFVKIVHVSVVSAKQNKDSAEQLKSQLLKEGEAEQICRDAEQSLKELQVLIQSKVDEGMAVVKTTLLSAEEGEGDDE